MNDGGDEGALVTDEGVSVTDGVGEDGLLSILQRTKCHIWACSSALCD